MGDTCGTPSSPEPDRGIGQHEPIDTIWMARGQPRRDCSAEGVPSDTRLPHALRGDPLGEPVRRVV